MIQYRVSPHCSVILPDRKQILAGELLPDNHGLQPRTLKQHLANRYVYPVGSSVETERQEDVLPPGVDEPVPTPSKDTAHILTSGKNDPTIKISTKKKPTSKISPWVFDPAFLRGKSLDELNVMVQELDDTVAPLETPEEAVGFLSQDFQPHNSQKKGS